MEFGGCGGVCDVHSSLLFPGLRSHHLHITVFIAGYNYISKLKYLLSVYWIIQIISKRFVENNADWSLYIFSHLVVHLFTYYFKPNADLSAIGSFFNVCCFFLNNLRSYSGAAAMTPYGVNQLISVFLYIMVLVSDTNSCIKYHLYLVQTLVS